MREWERRPGGEAFPRQHSPIDEHQNRAHGRHGDLQGVDSVTCEDLPHRRAGHDDFHGHHAEDGGALDSRILLERQDEEQGERQPKRADDDLAQAQFIEVNVPHGDEGGEEAEEVEEARNKADKEYVSCQTSA